ncbi:MAG: hypothetical protein ACTSSQ_05845, partial [Alphaproteobacteria bacterium]
SWDKASLNLPFGRMVLAYGEPIHIPRKISGPEMAEWRQVVAEGLNEVTERAHAIADGIEVSTGPETGPPKTSQTLGKNSENI